MPEYMIQSISQEQALYDYLREKNVDVEEWINIADRAITATEGDISEFTIMLTSPDPVKRYWAAVALRILGEEAGSAAEKLKYPSQKKLPRLFIR